MRNRMAALAVCACLCACLGASAAAETGVTEICDRAGLEAVTAHPEGSYVLTADIDMGGAPWTPVPLYGVFDGGGHTLFNLTVTGVGPDTAVTVDGNRLEYETEFAALFSVVKGARICDLTLLGAEICVKTSADCFAACLAGYAENSVIENCRVVGRVQLETGGRMAGVAGWVGFGRGCAVWGSTADVTLTHIDTDSGQDCEAFLGGAMACGYAQILDGYVKLRGYASVFGYVHSGGYVGMYYALDKRPPFTCYLRDCTVDAQITFFEKVKSRRAYCKAVIGENLFDGCKAKNNTVDAFEKTEVKTYDTPLLPEKCASPAYDAAVTEPTCTTYGYTVYTCRTCGYAYTADYTLPRHTYGEPLVTAPTCTEQGYTTHVCTVCGDTVVDAYTAPAHRAGEWTTVAEPAYGQAGEEHRCCTVCGQVLESRAIPPLARVTACVPDATDLELAYRETAALSVRVEPSNAADASVVWSSMDTDVATVSSDGAVTATGRGQTKLICQSADGGGAATCEVKVGYTFGQWLIVILLFGWIWY